MESVFQNKESPRENTITFVLSPTHVAYANTLRRLCMTSVESIGFRADMTDNGSTTDVQVLANSTPMTNEMLAHRIGLIPLHVKAPLQWDPEKYTFLLNKVNDTDKPMDIYASDFQVLMRKGEEEVAIPSSTFFPPHPVTRQTSLLAVLKPLMTGGKPEEIRIKAKATVGIGRENARFIPTAQCAYAYTKDKRPEAIQRVFHEWLQSVKMVDPATIEADSAKKAPLEREFNTLQVNRCYLKDDKTGEPYSFDFTVESVGVLDPEYIVLRACEKGAELCKMYAGENLGNGVVVQRADGMVLAWDFIFQRQDHTLGHLIQAWIDANLISQGEINFCGYDIPHPLRDEMVIRIGSHDGEEATARKALRTAMAACQAMFQSWRDQWASIVQPAAQMAPSTAAAKTQKRITLKRPTTQVTVEKS
jgi:DNA-directed RNA polymerase subunit D